MDSGREFGLPYDLNLQVDGSRLVSSINGRFVLEAENLENMYNGGGIALIAEVGRIGCDHVEVHPIDGTTASRNAEKIIGERSIQHG